LPFPAPSTFKSVLALRAGFRSYRHPTDQSSQFWRMTNLVQPRREGLEGRDNGPRIDKGRPVKERPLVEVWCEQYPFARFKKI
jgi:hypothetical protein